MPTKTHMCLSIAGALRQPDSSLKWFTDENGRAMTAKQVRAYLKLADFEGKRVLPMGDCDNFDYVKGCLGHEMPEDLPLSL
jgi:hypothetical protein